MQNVYIENSPYSNVAKTVYVIHGINPYDANFSAFLKGIFYSTHCLFPWIGLYHFLPLIPHTLTFTPTECTAVQTTVVSPTPTTVPRCTNRWANCLV